MANRFERGKIPPYSNARPTTGGVKITPTFSILQDPENVVLAGALYPIYTAQSDSTFLQAESSLELCASGVELSRSEFPDCFDRLGVTWGSGDGSTTFGIPDFSTNARYCACTGAGPNISGVGTKLDYTTELHAHSYASLRSGVTWPSAGNQNQRRPNEQFPPTGNNPFGNSGNDVQVPRSTIFKTWLGLKDDGTELPVGTIIMTVCPLSTLDSLLTDNPTVTTASGGTIDLAQYPKWFAVQGSASLPDFRGRFLGLADNSIVASGTFTSSTNSNLGRHYHTKSAVSYRNTTTNTGPQQNKYRGGDPPNTNAIGGPGAVTTLGTLQYSIGPGTETRPYNGSITYLVKVA